MEGTYRAKYTHYGNCGGTVFTMPKGATVDVEKVSTDGKDLLVRYGGRDIDWMGKSKFDKRYEAV